MHTINYNNIDIIKIVNYSGYGYGYSYYSLYTNVCEIKIFLKIKLDPRNIFVK